MVYRTVNIIAYILYQFFLFFSIDTRKPSHLRAPNEQWSGEATRTSGFMVEDTRVDVTIGDESSEDNAANRRKERPIWMMESTVINADGSQADDINTQETILDKAAATATNTTTTNTKQGEDIMSVLLAHEKKSGTNSTTSAIKAVLPQESSDSSDNEEINDMQTVDTGTLYTKQYTIIYILTIYITKCIDTT